MNTEIETFSYRSGVVPYPGDCFIGGQMGIEKEKGGITLETSVPNPSFKNFTMSMSMERFTEVIAKLYYLPGEGEVFAIAENNEYYHWSIWYRFICKDEKATIDKLLSE